MKLFGVEHTSKYLDQQIALIKSISGGVQGKSVMLELAPNQDAYVEQGILHPGFFMALRDDFKASCSRVILGDQELTIPENPDWMIAAFLGEDYFYPNNQRDEVMAKTAEAEHPDIIVVGNGHSDDLKRVFPDAYYTVFQEKGGCTSGHHGRPHVWHRPNRIISL